ncbi:MAG: CBS domain-containing protein [Deltaproteobacteria bacterium]|nr:CBS domain-containing protein [Deltaproteobacteria bacterium]
MEIITTHKSTDFDALASVIAGTLIYPGVVPVLPKTINPNVKAFLSIHKDLFKTLTIDKINPEKITRLIVVDTNTWGRTGLTGKFKDHRGFEIVLWDHHPGGDIKPDWKCQEEIGATITLMLRHIKAHKIELTPVHATLFLAGLYEDTGGLSFPSTTAEDAYAAGYLLENKADLNILSKFLRPAYGERQKAVLFKMLQNAQRKKVKGFTISCNIVEIEKHVGNLAIVIQMYREILNIDAAFGIFKQKDGDRCTVISRSNVEDLNVGLIMKSMGGGGHSGAGSAMIKSVKPEAIEEWIMELITGNQISSVTVSDLMSYPVVSIGPDKKMKDVVVLLREQGYTGVPVIDNGKLQGVISIRDFKKVRKDQMDAPAKAFMSRKNFTITPDRSPMEAAGIMVKHDIGRLPVEDNGKIIGIITRSDSMRYFYDLLPE